MSSRRQQVVALLKSLETRDPAPLAVIHPDRYTQHNLAVGDGLAGLGELLAALPPGATRVDTVRVFEDGDFVFAHSEYEFFGRKTGFDVFRFEEGRIVEHWDNLQETPRAPNPSGRTMTDGPTEPHDLALTAINKRLVADFVDDVLAGGKLDRIGVYIDADDYRQHNPAIADGLSGLGAALEAMAEAGVTMRYARVHRVLGEGSFVLVISEGEFAGRHVAFYDLFRVARGRIVEHWDVIENVPPRAEWKNPNGKF